MHLGRTISGALTAGAVAGCIASVAAVAAAAPTGRVATAACAAATGAGAARSAPSVYRPPAGLILACVNGHAIRGRTFTHWLIVARDSTRRRDGSRPPADHTDLLQVMSFLINAQWLIDEAARDHVSVTRAQVDRRFQVEKRHQFRTAADYRRFKRSSGEDTRDFELRVRLELLSNAIRRWALANAHATTPAAQEQAMSAFVTSFTQRWTAVTSCRRAYHVTGCCTTPLPAGG